MPYSRKYVTHFSPPLWGTLFSNHATHWHQEINWSPYYPLAPMRRMGVLISCAAGKYGIYPVLKDKMDIDISFNCSEINWNIISETLKQVGMAYYAPDLHKKAFEASYTSVFAWHGGQLIGFGRAISDGVYQAAVYDVAVVPEFQGKGIGSVIMKNILNKLSQCNTILYASPGKEKFYETLDFRKMKTGMALFTKAEAMAERGFTE